MSLLRNEIKEIIASKIHKAKSSVHDKLSLDVWSAIPSDEIGEECVDKIVEMIELWMYLPCCHTSGMHDPTHFAEKKGVCQSQKSEAFERFCKALEINPVTRSEIDCGWCRDYPDKRKGEGLRLFSPEEIIKNKG